MMKLIKQILWNVLWLWATSRPVEAWKLNFSRQEKHLCTGNTVENETIELSDSKLPREAEDLEGCQFPLVNPLDAVHCSSISESKIDLLSVRLATQFLFLLCDRVKSIICYKPPLGAVAVGAISHLLLSGRVFPFWNRRRESHNVEDALFLQQQQEKRGIREKRRGRSFNLDCGDSAYVTYGGIQCVRRRLLISALSSPRVVSPNYDRETGYVQGMDETFSNAIVDSLGVSSKPTEAWVGYIYNMIEPMARMERSLPAFQSMILIHKQGRRGNPVTGEDMATAEYDRLAFTAVTTIRLCLTDAIARLCRDRILQTAYRLAKTVDYWERRIDFSQTINLMFQNLFYKSMERDRLCLALAKAAFDMEVTRLGEMTAILWNRPPDMSEKILVQARKATELRERDETNAATVSIETDRKNFTADPQNKQSMWRIRTLRFLFNFYHRWKVNVKRIFSIHKVNDMDLNIDSRSAVAAICGSNDEIDDDDGLISRKQWDDQAQEWIQEARRVTLRVIRQSQQSSTANSVASNSPKESFDVLEANWRNLIAKPDVEVEQLWRSVVTYVNNLSMWRRHGEGEKIRLRDIFGVNDWSAYVDLLSIPLTALYIYIADQIHERIVRRYWSQISHEAVNAAMKVGEIAHQRIWVPLKEIYNDIMNRSPTLMSALGLDAEETSLDQMLRDLNFGSDGTPAGRQEALLKATKQYERDLSNGLFTNLARGRLIRLLLLQVQQLKVGMLSALDTIDVLLQGNRIHFKVLATIPTLMFITYGTRYFFRTMYNIRAKDLRPVRAVHSEMSHYLSKIESAILLSRKAQEQERDIFPSSLLTATPNSGLQPSELGVLVLNMHRYLILLDFCSPLFPRSNCNELHQSLQQLTGSNGVLRRLDRERQLQWVSRIIQDHHGLVKYL